jgi:glycosyltransferase involved in cell wall biosynthesis
LPGAVGVKLANKKIKTVFTFRGMSILDEHYKINPVLRFLYRIFFRFFLLFIDEAVFVSQENFAKFGRGNLAKRGVMIYNGLDPSKNNFFSKEQVLDFFHKKTNRDFSEKYIIGSIGRLDYAKNYEFLINVFPEILKIKPRAVAVIIGEGPDRKKYETLIEENNLQEKIFLLGNIENGSRYLKGFDVLVLPSRYEGLSITLLEALFAGLPVLASAVGGNSEAVSLPEAEIYELDNKKDFLEKFEFLQPPGILKEIKEKNKSLKEKFNLENSADSYEKIYKE